MTAIDFNQTSVLSFDCYGTLIDWETGILNVLRPWADDHELDITNEGLLAAFAVAEPLVQTADPSLPYPDVLRQSMRELGKALGVVATPDEEEALGTSVPNWPAFDDSAAALAQLKQDFRLVILSNIDRASFAASNQKLGVEFDAIITAEDTGTYKPDHGHFRSAFDWLAAQSIDRNQLVHVAQSLYHDHVPAQALGILSVWIDRRHGRAAGGATKSPTTPVTPNLTFTNLAKFAAAACG